MLSSKFSCSAVNFKKCTRFWCQHRSKTDSIKCMNFGHYFSLDQTAQNSPNSDEIFETILFIFKRVRVKAEIVIYKWQGGFGDTSSWKHKHHWPWWTDTRDSLLIHFHLKSNLDKTFVVTNVKILNWGQNCCRPRPEHVPSLTTDLDSRFWGFCLLRYLSPQHIWVNFPRTGKMVTMWHSFIF